MQYGRNSSPRVTRPVPSLTARSSWLWDPNRRVRVIIIIPRHPCTSGRRRCTPLYSIAGGGDGVLLKRSAVGARTPFRGSEIRSLSRFYTAFLCRSTRFTFWTQERLFWFFFFFTFIYVVDTSVTRIPDFEVKRLPAYWNPNAWWTDCSRNSFLDNIPK